MVSGVSKGEVHSSPPLSIIMQTYLINLLLIIRVSSCAPQIRLKMPIIRPIIPLLPLQSLPIRPSKHATIPLLQGLKPVFLIKSNWYHPMKHMYSPEFLGSTPYKAIKESLPAGVIYSNLPYRRRAARLRTKSFHFIIATLIKRQPLKFDNEHALMRDAYVPLHSMKNMSKTSRAEMKRAAASSDAFAVVATYERRDDLFRLTGHLIDGYIDPNSRHHRLPPKY